MKITEVTEFWFKSSLKTISKKQINIGKHHLPCCRHCPGLVSPFEARGYVLIFEPYFGSGVEIEEITTRNGFSLFLRPPSPLFFGGRLLFTVIPFHCELKKDVLALKDEKNMS